MKCILLHGLGQRPSDWNDIVKTAAWVTPYGGFLHYVATVTYFASLSSIFFSSLSS